MNTLRPKWQEAVDEWWNNEDHDIDVVREYARNIPHAALHDLALRLQQIADEEKVKMVGLMGRMLGLLEATDVPNDVLKQYEKEYMAIVNSQEDR